MSDASIHPEAPLVAADRVFKTYRLGRVDVPVLRGASVEVKSGEWLAILGASGSGKSTLLHLLGGLDTPDRAPPPDAPGAPGAANAILFRGAPLRARSSRELDAFRRKNVGFVFQFYHLLPELTALENALLPAMALHGRGGFAANRRALRASAESLLRAFGLEQRLAHRPAQLSGGERQRVAIARALINEPDALLADEPTGNLDRATGETLLDAISRIRDEREQTIVMVTHDEGIARRADRVVHLRDGVVVTA